MSLNHFENDGVVGAGLITDQAEPVLLPGDTFVGPEHGGADPGVPLLLQGQGPKGLGGTNLAAGVAGLLATGQPHYRPGGPEPLKSGFQETGLQGVGNARFYTLPTPYTGIVKKPFRQGPGRSEQEPLPGEGPGGIGPGQKGQGQRRPDRIDEAPAGKINLGTVARFWSPDPGKIDCPFRANPGTGLTADTLGLNRLVGVIFYCVQGTALLAPAAFGTTLRHPAPDRSQPGEDSEECPQGTAIPAPEAAREVNQPQDSDQDKEGNEIAPVYRLGIVGVGQAGKSQSVRQGPDQVQEQIDQENREGVEQGSEAPGNQRDRVKGIKQAESQEAGDDQEHQQIVFQVSQFSIPLVFFPGNGLLS